MESLQQQLHNSAQTIESSVLLGSPLPAANFLQLSSSTLVPLGSSPTFGSVLSVPVISQPLMSPVHQKQHQSTQNEPLLLLPASALSLSTQSNIVISTPFLNSKIQSASVQHNQQQHQSNTSAPLILKTPDSSQSTEQTLNAQQINQKFVVFPVDETRRDLAQVSDKDNKQSSQHKNDLSSLTDKKGTKRGRLIAANLPAEKSDPEKPKLKMRNLKNKSTSIIKSENLVEDSVLRNSNFERSKLDIAQIISNIPPGWQVVGVTGPNQILLGDNMPSFSSSSLSSSSLAARPVSSAAEVIYGIQRDSVLVTDTFSAHEQPGLVSVNLNTSSLPVASETVIDKWPVNELTCSVKMDDIPCTHMLSVKTESPDSSEDSSAIVMNGSVFEQQDLNHVTSVKAAESHTMLGSVKADANKQLQAINGMELQKVPDSNILLKELSKLQSLTTSGIQPVTTDSKWTVVGITSLSPLLPTNTVTTSQVPMPAAQLTTLDGHSSNATLNKPSALDATILKIPLCSSSGNTLANKVKNTEVSKRNSILSLQKIPAVAIENDGESHNSSLFDMTKPDGIKWTVVGIVGSPLSNSSTLNPCIPSPSEYLNTPSLVNTSRLGNVVNAQLLNVLPSLSSVDPSTKLPASMSPEHPSLSKEANIQSKSQETENKSPKSEALLSNDDLIVDHASSLNHWKVVGVTQLGMPLTAASPALPVPPRNPISPVMSMPFLIPAASGPSFSNYTTDTTNMLTHPTGAAQSSNLLPSLATSPSLLSPSTLQFPVLNIGSTSCSSALTVSPPSAILNAASPVSIPGLADLAQQQNLSQLIQSQLPVCQNMLTLNDTNQWNVIGFVANNQVSLLNASQSNPPVVNSVTPLSKPSTESLQAHPVSSSSTMVQNKKLKQITSSTDGKKVNKGIAGTKNVTIRQSLVSRLEDTNSKRGHLKCKDLMNKQQQESSKVKKNTVSNLLRIKRMQQKTSENGSSEDGDQSIEIYQDFSNTSYEVPRKKIKTRSLRSYAGNRKIFTRAQNKTSDGKISLRSGTLVSCKSESDDNRDDDARQNLARIEEEKISDSQEAIKGNHDDKDALVAVEVQSSSRRRKLKVPRKLIADLDYHPFDSSSESS